MTEPGVPNSPSGEYAEGAEGSKRVWTNVDAAWHGASKSTDSRGGQLAVWMLGRVRYEHGLALQEQLVARKLSGDATDYLLVLEHDPVFTLGRGASENDLCGADRKLGIPAFRVGRGGGVTYHGPGQLVAYPIVRLRRPSVRTYVELLLDVVVEVCARFGVRAWADREQIGVWTERGKIASVGVGIRRWVAFHGVALNVTNSLDPFQQIVVCRTPGLAVTSLALELQHAPEMSEVVPCFVEVFSVYRRKFMEGGPE